MNRQLLSKLWTNFNSCSLYSRYYLKKRKNIIPKTIIIKSKKQFYLIFYIELLCLRICLEILNFILFLSRRKKKNPIYFFIFCSEKFCSYLMYLIHVHKILKGKRWYIFCSTILCCLKNLNMILEFLDASIINMTYH